MKLAVLRVAMARWMAIAVLVVLGTLLPQSAGAGIRRRMSAAERYREQWRHLVSINISDCAFNIGFAAFGGY